MVAHDASGDAAHILLRVRAAMKVHIPKTESWTQRDAQEELIATVVGAAVTCAMDVQLLFSAGRIIRKLVYVPMALLPLHVIAGFVLVAIMAWRYACEKPTPVRVWVHPYADLLADPRWPFWRAMVRAQDQCQALRFYAVLVPMPHRELALQLLATGIRHLREADRDLLLFAQYDQGDPEVLQRYAERLRQMTLTLERDARVMEAFRASPVE